MKYTYEQYLQHIAFLLNRCPMNLLEQVVANDAIQALKEMGAELAKLKAEAK